MCTVLGTVFGGLFVERAFISDQRFVYALPKAHRDFVWVSNLSMMLISMRSFVFDVNCCYFLQMGTCMKGSD